MNPLYPELHPCNVQNIGTTPTVTNLSQITTISFDVDGTLWDFETFTRQALQQTLEELSRHDPRAAARLDVDMMIDIREQTHADMWGRINDLDAIREESMRRALREVGRPNDALGSHLTRYYFQRRNQARTLFPDVRPALERLAPHYSLGLLSNGNSRAKVLGIQDLISFEVFSQDHDAMDKPDPRIFQITMRQAGCQPHRLLHVGDSLPNDAWGAFNVGVVPAWLDRDGAASDTLPFAVINSLSEIPLMLLAEHVMERH